MSQRRAAWLSGAAALGAVAFAGRSPAAAQTAAVLRVAGASTEGLSEGDYAEAMGFFRAHGLTVELRRLPTAAPIGPAIASGDVQIGCGNALAVGQAHAHGVPFVIIAMSEEHQAPHQTAAIVVPVTSAITRPRELNGKTVAVSTLNGLEALGIRAAVDKDGGDSSSLRFLELGPLMVADGLTSGRVDAANLPEPELSAAGDRLRRLASGEDAISLTHVQTVWYAQRSWAEANKETARRFADAVYAAGGWATANPDKAAVILSSYLGFKVARAYARFATKPNLPGIQVLYDVAAKYNVFPPINAADFFWDGK